jgi:type IV pilus assembly protein PilE
MLQVIQPKAHTAINGFSLPEAMVALAIVAMLATLSYPSFTQALRKARRAEAWASLHQIQRAQARHRSLHPHYGSLADIRWHPGPEQRHYALRLTRHDGSGYTVLATAQNAQAADVSCRHLQMDVQGLQMRQTSGPTTELSNDEYENQRCWAP